ncbi:glycosyltransferase [Methylobacterium planeticum]|uniref:Glycosyltransferase n=1 Tax=Methylobacterium planeticum TaxID=2615211 RepID=A0A6N6MQ43_9HYPH|nr:glycosyltransferase [Methylobacterium planeticum]KAB1072725.1 glycosyltransferase [Methylobacterium planeticum]
MRQPVEGRAASRLHKPFLLYGVLCFCFGVCMYLAGVLLVFPRYLLQQHALLDPVAEALVWYSGLPILTGITLALFDLLVLLKYKKPDVAVRFEPVRRRRVTVALTAYDDENSIGGAVADFLNHPLVERVIVVSNNSRDRTAVFAQNAGALVFDELEPGYGRCVFRCLSEAVKFTDTDFVVLCEGDSTFRAYDIEKLLAYAPHADIVNGTRTVEPLRQYITQLSTFIYYGNLFVGKLLEAKHLGRGTITDVGTTYKLCRRDALIGLLDTLNPAVNLEFNAHFLDRALARGLVLLECPITFHQRVGVSKGGNVNNWRGFTVGSRMIVGLLFDWRRTA